VFGVGGDMHGLAACPLLRSFFFLSPTGIIFVNTLGIDYETKNFYNLTVTVLGDLAINASAIIYVTGGWVVGGPLCPFLSTPPSPHRHPHLGHKPLCVDPVVPSPPCRADINEPAVVTPVDVSVVENSPVGTVLASKINYTDQDLGDFVTFTLIRALAFPDDGFDTSNAFEVNPVRDLCSAPCGPCGSWPNWAASLSLVWTSLFSPPPPLLHLLCRPRAPSSSCDLCWTLRRTTLSPSPSPPLIMYDA
jgi:hypothetical protein